ncbi:hypothetical protein Q1695_010583 [Nippostrongylus brasiliensis]|nr:hypothetical protein Q1695_010583 [Nippostrongylus brasiliensis]
MSVVSDVKLLDFPSQHTSFTRAFFNYVARYANADALIDPYTGEKLSFLDLSLKVDQSRLRLSSIPKGSIVISVCGNSISLIVVYLALLDLGMTIVPVNPASKQYELEKYLTECRAQYVLTEKDYAMKVGAILVQSKFETISTIVLEELPTEKEPTHMNLPTEPGSEDTAFVFFSSGTTGPPKPIRHSHRSLVAHLRQIRSVMDSNSDTYPFPCLRLGDRTHGVLPYFHAGGLLTVFCMLVQGATVVVNGKWNEEGFLRILQDHQVRQDVILSPTPRLHMSEDRSGEFLPLPESQPYDRGLVEAYTT